MTASRVPASRFSRALHYTGLGIGMTFGAITEGIKRAATGGGGGGGGGNSIMLSEANVERLVRKLSRMRGAALKLGQMLSLQGNYHLLNHHYQPHRKSIPPTNSDPVLLQTPNSFPPLSSKFSRESKIPQTTCPLPNSNLSSSTLSVQTGVPSSSLSTKPPSLLPRLDKSTLPLWHHTSFPPPIPETQTTQTIPLHRTQ